MDKFLRKINLIKDVNINLKVSKIDFIKKFRENVDESNLDFEPFEIFRSSSNEYKGNILNASFELTKRRKFFDTNYTFAKVTGDITEENEHLTIDAEINGFRKRMIPFFAIAIIFYLIFFIAFIFSKENPVPFFVAPFILVHMSLMIGIPYFVMKKSVKRMAYDLERDFHYWVTKN